MSRPSRTPSVRPRVIVIGAGFGGLAATRALADAPVDVTVIDQRNHHLFQPLLYQVATAALSPADIAEPVRRILRDQANARVVLDSVTGVDRANKRVRLAGGDALGYDWLIIASGARHSYFGRNEWAAHAPGIKTLEDAIATRHKVLLALERAEAETDKARRDALLTFVVIGGGPTGVELAGAIAELAHKAVNREFRTITPHCSRVILIQGGERLLEAFPEALSKRALEDLRALGVDVRLSAIVDAVTEDSVVAGGERISTRTAIWAAGVEASPAARWLGVKADAAGRAIVDHHLHPEADPSVFVIGDTAHCPNAEGKPLPGIAPVAKQQGVHAAKQIRAALQDRRPRPFRYRHYGNLATIGRSRAVIDFGWLRVQGMAAWLLWSTAHLFFLAGFRSRLHVGLNLLWNYLTFSRHARLITAPVLDTRRLQVAEP